MTKPVTFDLDARPTKANQINKILKSRGRNEVLVRGRGYWNFTEGETGSWHRQSVYVYRISELTIGEWLAEFDALAADFYRL